MAQVASIPCPSVRYLSEKTVAEMTGVSVKTLQSHRFKRRGIPYSKFGRIIRYAESDVVAHLASCRINPAEGR